MARDTPHRYSCLECGNLRYCMEQAEGMRAFGGDAVSHRNLCIVGAVEAGQLLLPPGAVNEHQQHVPNVLCGCRVQS